MIETTRKRLSQLAMSLGFVLGLSFPVTTAFADVKEQPAADTSILFLQGQEKIEAFRSQRELAPTRLIAPGTDVLELERTLADVSDLTIATSNGTLSLDEYLKEANVAGLMVVQDGKVLLERYLYGNTKDTRWISFSVTKSVVSMLIGAAIEDGYIRSDADLVTDYLPRLQGSGYDDVTVRNLLQMSSGVQWNEDYADPASDVASAPYATLELYDFLAAKPSVAKPGERFNYNTAETNLAGTLLRSAIGNNLSSYLSSKIWGPFGMRSHAYWNLTEVDGGEFGGCCISATLGDYARLGMFALADGVLADGTRVLPEGWMQRSIEPSKGYDGYGYFWWLLGDGRYRAAGIFGQGIYIDPDNKLVVAMHSAWEHADTPEDDSLKLVAFDALSRYFAR
ncbi:MAG: beta-lactamase family protein [Pseudomonadaceae bacterium]|nr:beta-lactamase family protein [Pseudomonadaceae bacterium]